VCVSVGVIAAYIKQAGDWFSIAHGKSSPRYELRHCSTPSLASINT